MATTRSDEELLTAFTRGDRTAFRALAERHECSLLGLARGLLDGRQDLACDAVQETWVRVIRFAATFDGRSRFKTWLYQIAVNQCRNLRATRTASAVDAGERSPVAAQSETPAETAEQNQRLRRTVEALSDDKRFVVLLCYHEGLTHEEAAEILGIPLGTLKSRLHAALEELRSMLGAEAKP